MWQYPQCSSQVSISQTGARGKSGFLVVVRELSCSKGIGPHVEMKYGTQGSSQVGVGNSGSPLVATGILGILWSCLHKGNQASFQVSRGTSGLLSSCCRQIGPHLASREESHGFSRVVAGTSGFRLSYDQDLREPLVLTQ